MIIRRSKPSTGDGIDPRLIPGLSAYWDTSSGAYTLTALNQISQLDDLSGNGKHLVQATAANQPYLSRSDNQENLIRYSEDISQVSGTTYWQYTRAANISATEYKEDGNTGTHVVGQTNLVAVAGATYRIALRVKRGAGERNFRVMVAWSDGKFSYAYVNPSLGTLTGTTGTTQAWAATPTVTASTDSYFQFEAFVASPVTSVTNTLNFGITTNTGTISYAGDNTSSLHLTSVVFQDSRAASTHLPTTTFPQYRGLNGYKVAVYDGAASYLTCDALAAMFVGPDAPFTAMITATPKGSLADQKLLTAAKSSATTPYYVIKIYSDDHYVVQNHDGTSSTYLDAGHPDPGTNIISFQTTGTVGNFWINSLKRYSNRPMDVGELTGLNQFTIGANRTSSINHYFNGSISAMALFSRALSESERYGVERFFIRKFIPLT